MFGISYISNKFIPQSLMYYDNNIDGHVLSMYFDLQDKIKMNERVTE
jgi:hypothetical protein